MTKHLSAIATTVALFSIVFQIQSCTMNDSIRRVGDKLDRVTDAIRRCKP